MASAVVVDFLYTQSIPQFHALLILREEREMIGIAAISFLCLLVLLIIYHYKTSKKKFRINGKTILITGASSGIGRGTYDSLKRRKRVTFRHR